MQYGDLIYLFRGATAAKTSDKDKKGMYSPIVTDKFGPD